MKKITAAAAVFIGMFLFSCAAAEVGRDYANSRGGQKTGPRIAREMKKERPEKIVNVLCYHRFVERKELPEHRIIRGHGDIYSITPENFESHLKYFKENENVISMSRYLDWLDGKGDIPDRSLIITIDDGYRCTYAKAAPLLEKYSMPAVFYLYNDFMPGGKNALTKSMVRELVERGFEIGSHSASHPNMASNRQSRVFGGKKERFDDEEYLDFLVKETADSKEYLENYLGVPVRTFSYPYGAYSEEIIPFVKAAGFEAAFSVVPSYNINSTPGYALKRHIVYNFTTIEDLKEKFAKKPLKIEIISPRDGWAGREGKLRLQARIVDDSKINTSTVRFRMGRVTLENSSYNPQTKMLIYQYEKDLSWGTHKIAVIAEGNDGSDYEYAWQFVRKNPADKNLLKKRLKELKTKQGDDDAGKKQKKGN
ncbi:MAG TPA: polysaccharide deacetylase family protein [Firmicutes bacterium]|nr:polysaccharide deacetylase family protein [Bacillota bacterium]